MPLDHELFALVDACDAERVLARKWHPKRSKRQPDKLYAQHTIRLTPGRKGKKTTVSLHRFVLGDEHPLVDHQNGNGLDCRRQNLRPATHRENSANVTSSKRQKLGGYKGVSWNKLSGKWQASICAGEIKPNGKRRQLYLGVFANPAEAARAYDRKALEAFGPFASLNFPDDEAAEFAIALAESSTDYTRAPELGRAVRKATRAYIANGGRS